MFRPAALTLLAAMAASPAMAQVGTGSCNPHRANEVRCAVRIDIPGGNRVYNVVINATRMGAEARMTTDTYISTCGSAGQMVGRSNIANSGSSRVATFTNERNQAGMVAQALAGFCVETFLTTCSSNGQAANCQQVLNLGATKIEVR
ncbi:hypothetical protein [Sediminicoccus rosea]|jgi:hypothetical protein|uniref:Uncharacterized protein n=1 Tax=Sediminicoccus rosea TaxID=1225128 RepID=A0ABZ0PFM9_9PROT|nr:hypothetical protein [Sediminicoccus rosea]WPB84538.1 hypothetical protein R9Z33_20875 [Sediminicoccus rosea]